MPQAFPSTTFSGWLAQNATPAEQRSVTAMVRDLNRYGLARGDPALTTLVQGHFIGGSQGLSVNVFVMPERISAGLGQVRTMWFGIVEVAASSTTFGSALVGRLLLLKGWASDPNVMGLVAAEQALVALAQTEYP